MATATERPNIRIEIQNNLVEPMEVDEPEKVPGSDFEDGEISDNNDSLEEPKSAAKLFSNRAWNNIDGGFTTGVDIFDKKEQEKLQERANRFGLKPSEIKNFTDEHLQELHASLGISAENEKNVRFEAVHMRGTDEMSTEDVFEYFGKYGPAFVEWINDESCNVVWKDKVSAARALHFISKAVKGMPVEGPRDPFAKDVKTDDTENAMISENREVQLEKEDDLDQQETSTNNITHISEIKGPIPPGYWRIGIEHLKTKCILLRFAFKTDKKPMKAERFSEYYKKYGNPNFGGMRGLISESRRRKFKGIFERNKDIVVEGSKNPWGDLAENWNLDEQFSEKPPMPVKSPSLKGLAHSDIMKRLGSKRDHESDDGSESNEEEEVKKKSKVPRMRMYADEEEEKLNRKKQLLKLKLNKPVVQEKPSMDLRNIIKSTTKKTERKREWDLEYDNDLGNKLKVTISSSMQADIEAKKIIMSKAARNEELALRLAGEKMLSSLRRSPSVEKQRHKEKKSSSRGRSSRYENKLHSDRHEHRYRRSLSHERVANHKPRSKVAVVIKTQKTPTVASTIWSRITPKKERLKTASERLRTRKESSSSSDESSASSSSSSDSSSESSSESEEEANIEEPVQVKVERPGFTSAQQSAAKMKSPLRIEINNDHFKEE